MPVLGRCAARLYSILLHSHASCVDSAWSSDLRLGDDDVSFLFLSLTPRDGTCCTRFCDPRVSLSNFSISLSAAGLRNRVLYVVSFANSCSSRFPILTSMHAAERRRSSRFLFDVGVPSPPHVYKVCMIDGQRSKTLANRPTHFPT